MKILFLTKELPYPCNNGHRTRSLNLIKGLSKNNKISLICFGSDGDEEGIEVIKSYGVSIELIPEKASNSKWSFYFSVLFGLFSSIPFSVKKKYSFLMREKIKALLEKEDIDLIFCDGVHQSFHLPVNKCSKIIAEHNIESMIIYRYFKVEKNIFKKLYAFVEWFKMCRFENKMWGRFSHYFVVSEKDKEMISGRIEKKNIDVIPNGVDTNYFCPQNIKVRPFTLIYTGQMDWFPNEDAVVYFLKEIYPLIKRETPQVSFWIVGNMPSERIKKLAKEDKTITVTGFVEDVRPYVAQSEIFVVPLRIGAGTRLKILEAMAMKKPVISTGIGCEGLDITHKGNIIVSDKSDDFAEKVIELFKNPSLAGNLGMSGRNLVEEKYSWDRIIEKLDKSIKSIKGDYSG